MRKSHPLLTGSAEPGKLRKKKSQFKVTHFVKRKRGRFSGGCGPSVKKGMECDEPVEEKQLGQKLKKANLGRRLMRRAN